MKMFHSTSLANYQSIINCGSLSGPVYLATTKELAADYGSNNGPDFVVIELCVDGSELCADMEFVKGEMSVEDAVEESLSNGSCFIDGDVSIAGHTVYEYEDFEEVES